MHGSRFAGLPVLQTSCGPLVSSQFSLPELRLRCSREMRLLFVQGSDASIHPHLHGVGGSGGDESSGPGRALLCRRAARTNECEVASQAVQFTSAIRRSPVSLSCGPPIQRPAANEASRAKHLFVPSPRFTASRSTSAILETSRTSRPQSDRHSTLAADGWKSAHLISARALALAR